MANPRFKVAPPPAGKQEGGEDRDHQKGNESRPKPKRRDDDPFILTAADLTPPAVAPVVSLVGAPGPHPVEPMEQAPEAAGVVDHHPSSLPGSTEPEPPATAPAGQESAAEALTAPVDGRQAPELSPGPLLSPGYKFQTHGGHTPAPDRLVALLSKVDNTRASIPATPAKEDVGIVTHSLYFPVTVARDLVKAGKPTSLANAAIRWAVSSACRVHPTEFSKVFEVLKETRRRPSPDYPIREGKAKHTTAVLTLAEDQAVGVLAGKASLTHAALCEAATYLYLYSVALPPAGAAGNEAEG